MTKFLKTLLICSATFFLVACGSGGGGSEPVTTTPPPVATPPPTPPDVSITQEAAAKFLTQASFGATSADIESLADMGYEAWLDNQFSLPVGEHLPYLEALPEIQWRDHISAWLSRAATSDDQLRQRVAFALSEIWVVSLLGVDFPNGDVAFTSLANYYDILLQHSFGNYRDLMKDVTLSPVMGEYLSMKGNRKADPANNILPDENYAREMMQLFSIGLHELNMDGTQKLDAQGNPIPTYDQNTIEDMARVFTGWHFANLIPLYEGTETIADFINPMTVSYPDWHDTEQKVVLGEAVIPAGQTAEQDLDDMLDIVFNHPNVAPFISKQIIQKLVTSNPSNAYVERVANVFANNGRGVRGDMQAVVRAVLSDDEAITGNTDKVFGKLKEPLVRMAGLWRTFNASAANGEYRLTWFGDSFGQAPLESPSVFNFFSPFYSPSGEFQSNNWVAPEFQIHTEANQTKMTNFFQWLVYSQNNYKENPEPFDVLINLTNEAALATDNNALMDHYNLLLFGGDMSANLRTLVLEYIDGIPAEEPERRAVEALGVLIVSPEFMVQN